MGKHLTIVSHDEVFHSLKSPPVIVNDVDVFSLDAKANFNDLISSRYDQGGIDNVPSCDCNALQGQYNIDKICTVCHTPVQYTTERQIESNAWIRTPSGVTGLINPIIYIMLSNSFKAKSCNLIEWLCNPSYTYQGAENPTLNKLISYGFTRGLNSFHTNFNQIIEALFDIMKVEKHPPLQHLRQLLHIHRDKLFSQYLPIPSKVAFVVERTTTGTIADPAMKLALDAIRTISSINVSIKPMTLKQRELRAFRATQQLADYYKVVFKDTLAAKTGLFRRHIMSGRSHYTARAVITSISEPHQYDEIHLPWSLSVGLFKNDITSKLLRRGYTPRQTERFINAHTKQYHPLLDDIFKELISEAPKPSDIIKHIPIPQENDVNSILMLLQRNPSLAKGSAQAVRVTKVKTEVADLTIGVGLLIITSMNADFDGDALNLLLILDNKMYKEIYKLSPHHSVLSMDAPEQVSNAVGLPNPLVSTIDNYLQEVN